MKLLKGCGNGLERIDLRALARKHLLLAALLGARGLTRKHADMLLNAIIKPTIKPLGYQVKRADDDPTPGARARLLQRRLGFAFAAKHELVMSCR